MPLLTKALPNVTVIPGEQARLAVLVADHFSDPQGDDLVPTATMREVSGFVTLTVITVPAAQASFTIVAAPPEETADTEIVVDVFVTDALGVRSATHTLTVTVQRTWWQKAKDIVYAMVGLVSFVVTIAGCFWIVPFVYNLVMRGSKIIPCPVSAAHPEHRLPEGTAVTTHHLRDSSPLLDKLRAVCLPGYLFDELTFVDTHDGGLPSWLELSEFVLALQPEEGKTTDMPVVHFRMYSKHGFLLQQFEVDFAVATKGWKYGSNGDGAAAAAAAAAATSRVAGYEIEIDSDAGVVEHDFGAAPSSPRAAASAGNGTDLSIELDMLRMDQQRVEREQRAMISRVDAVRIQASMGQEELEQQLKEQHAELQQQNTELRREVTTLREMMERALAGVAAPASTTQQQLAEPLLPQRAPLPPPPPAQPIIDELDDGDVELDEEEIDEVLQQLGGSGAVGHAERANAAQLADLQASLSGIGARAKR